MTQLLLFEDPVDYKHEFEKLKEQMDKLRKSVFMKVSEQNKRVLEISHDHELLKLHICRGKIVV